MAARRQSLCLVLLMPTLAWAYDAPSADVFDLSLEDLRNLKVVTASRQAESLQRAPGTILVVTRQQIRERGYTNLLDVLRDLPGIDVHGYHYAINSDAVSWRGVYGNQKFIILQDGVRISPTASEPLAITQNYPLYHADQVEVVYGPASALYGADAFTGVINIITATGEDGQASASVGQNGYRYASVYTGRNLAPEWRLAIGADYFDTDGADLARQYPALFQLQNLLRFDGSVALPAQQRAGFDAPLSTRSVYLSLAAPYGLSAGLNRVLLDSLATRSEAPDKVNYGGRPQWNFSVDTAYLRSKLKLGERVTSEATLSYSRTEVDPVSSFDNQVTGYLNAYKYSLSEAWSLNHQLGWQVSASQHLSAGYSFERTRGIPLTADLPAPYDTSKASDNQGMYYVGTNNTLPIRIFHADYQTAGMYGQLKSDWGPQWSTTVGARRDHNTVYGNSTTPRLSVVYLPRDADTLKLQYAEAFLAPSPLLTYRHFGTFSGKTDAQGRYVANSFFLPNPDLKPETMKMLELSYGWQATPALRVTLTLYRQRVQDFISTSSTPVPFSDFIAGGVIGATRYNANVGTLNSRGGEVMLNYDVRVAGVQMKTWANYSRTDGDLTLLGKPGGLPLVARDKFKAGASCVWGNVVVSPSLYLIGRTHGAQGSDAQGVPGYALLNLAATLREVAKGVDLFVNIDNLSNRRYYNATLVGAPNQFVQSPQPLRSLNVGMTLRF